MRLSSHCDARVFRILCETVSKSGPCGRPCLVHSEIKPAKESPARVHLCGNSSGDAAGGSKTTCKPAAMIHHVRAGHGRLAGAFLVKIFSYQLLESGGLLPA